MSCELIQHIKHPQECCTGYSKVHEYKQFDENKKPLWSVGGYRWSQDIFENTDFRWQPISKEEVFTAFKREAKKRGYKGGFTVKCLASGRNRSITTSPCAHQYYYRECAELFINATCIWKEGKWAEIIQEGTPHTEEAKDALIKYLMLKVDEIKSELDKFN